MGGLGSGGWLGRRKERNSMYDGGFLLRVCVYVTIFCVFFFLVLCRRSGEASPSMTV